MTETVLLRASEAAALAQAELAHAASKAGLRMLFIKGESSNQHGLREPRVSADVDVLVAPQDEPAVAELIAALGWTKRPTTLTDALFSTHSVDHLRAGWPCDLDIHRRFPGFLAPPQDVFDVMWQRRMIIQRAGLPCAIPDLTSSVAIFALHSLRGIDALARHKRELDGLCDRIEDGRVSVDKRDLVAFARQTGAVSTLQPLLVRLGLDVEAPAWEIQSKAHEVWLLSTTKTDANPHLWVRALLDSTTPRRLTIIRRALWPSAADMYIAYPDLQRSQTALVRARLGRLLRGLRALPSGLRRLARARAGRVASRQPSG